MQYEDGSSDKDWYITRWASYCETIPVMRIVSLPLAMISLLYRELRIGPENGKVWGYLTAFEMEVLGRIFCRFHLKKWSNECYRRLINRPSLPNGHHELKAQAYLWYGLNNDLLVEEVDDIRHALSDLLTKNDLTVSTRQTIIRILGYDQRVDVPIECVPQQEIDHHL